MLFLPVGQECSFTIYWIYFTDIFPFQLVHSDVWTSPVHSHSGYKYYVVFLDDYTHYLWTIPLRNKSDVFPTIRAFISYVHTQFCLPILAF